MVFIKTLGEEKTKKKHQHASMNIDLILSNFSQSRFPKTHYSHRHNTMHFQKNVTLTNNLLLNSYFENPTIGLYVLYILNIHVNFHANRV